MYGRELQHITARKMSFLAPFRFRKYFKFAFVRNPYRRIESEFNWRKSWDSATNKMSLSTFIDTIPYRLNEPHFMPANKFLLTSSGTFLVDFVGKFENMESDLQKINQWDGIRKLCETLHGFTRSSIGRLDTLVLSLSGCFMLSLHVHPTKIEACCA